MARKNNNLKEVDMTPSDAVVKVDEVVKVSQSEDVNPRGFFGWFDLFKKFVVVGGDLA